MFNRLGEIILNVIIRDLNQIMYENPEKHLICWGTGKNFEKFYNKYLNKSLHSKIKFLVDTDTLKVGNQYNEILKIQSYEYLCENIAETDILVITCKTYQEILLKILDDDCFKNKIIFLYEICRSVALYSFFNKNRWFEKYMVLERNIDVVYFESFISHVKQIIKMQFSDLICQKNNIELQKSGARKWLGGIWYLHPFQIFELAEFQKKLEEIKKETDYVIFNLPLQSEACYTEWKKYAISHKHVYIDTSQKSNLVVIDMKETSEFSECKIMVVTHKRFLPPKDTLYFPIHAGRKNKEDLGYIGDDSGDNISELNHKINECTALYWLWKNGNMEVIGLNHYRRYFANFIDYGAMIDSHTVSRLLGYFDILTVYKWDMEDWTLYDQLKNAIDSNAYEKGLSIIEACIKENQAEYLASFRKVFSGHEMYPFNMFIMKKSICDQYCQWLFSIIIEAAKKMETSQYDTYSQRVIGFFAERLFTVWLANHNFSIRELPFIQTEANPQTGVEV